MRQSKRVAILVPGPGANAETFINNHIKLLPFEKLVVFGGEVPYKTDPEQRLTTAERLRFKWLKVAGKLNGWKGYEKLTLRSILKKNNIDVVFAEYVNTGSNVLDVCRELNVPLVVTGLGYELSIYDVVRRNEVAYRNLLQYCSSVAVVANSMRGILVNLGCDEKKIVYTPAGASKEFLGVEPDFSRPQLFAIGRFIEKKSPHLTLLAFQLVLKSFPEAKLVMAGEGPLLQICKDLAAALHMTNSIIFAGRISQAQQMEFLRTSWVFVQHSRVAPDGDSEGTPVAIVEASAAGLPVVSTLHAGIPDVVIQNKTGFLVEEGNVSAMANAIITLLENRGLAVKMGGEGKRNIRENFSLDRHIDVLTQLIDKAKI